METMKIEVDGRIMTRIIDHYEMDESENESNLLSIIPKPIPVLFGKEEIIERFGKCPLIIKV